MSVVSRNSIASTEEEQLKRQGRALLYAIALLHLLCMGLLKQPPPAPAHAAIPLRDGSRVSREHRLGIPASLLISFLEPGLCD